MQRSARRALARLTLRVHPARGQHAPLANARTSWSGRDLWLVELGDDVARGFGEVCPLPGYSRESADQVCEELERLSRNAPTVAAPPPAGDWTALRAWLGEHTSAVSAASVRFGVETALLDYWAKRLALPLWRLLVSEPSAARFDTSEVVDVLGDATLTTVEGLRRGSGARTLKLKVGRDFEQELEVVRALRERWPAEQLRLRIDGNGTWPAASVSERLTALVPCAPEFVEEPCAPLDGASVAPVPLARDESLASRDPSADWLATERGVDVLVLKPMHLGGIGICLAWAEAARATNKRVVISHLFDGPWALAATAHLACALQSPDRALGLGRHRGLGAWRALAAPPTFVGLGHVSPPREPGLGVEPTERLSVAAAARECPTASALVVAGRELSFRDLARGVRRVAEWLEGRGVARAVRDMGRPVAFVAEPELGPLGLLYACLELGLPVLPLHPRARASEREAVLQELSPAWTVDAAQLEELTTELVRALDEPSADVASGEAPLLVACADPESDLAWVLTSGSTRRPKAVRLSRRAFLASADASAARLGWRADDRWLLSLPFAHVGGLSVLTRCLVARRTVVVGTSSADPERWTAEAAEQRATLLSLVPAQLARLLDSGISLPASVRAILLGGAAAPLGLLQRARERGLPVLRTYGLTEACSQVATERLPDSALTEEDTERLADRPATEVPEPGAADPGRIGPVLPGVEVRIGEGGAIEIRGDVLFSGYVGADDSFAIDGWFRTSDWGRLRDGELEVFGRLDHVIVSGGENIAPEAVEAELLVHPGVSSACVLGLPDPTWGECVTAVLVLRPGCVLRDVEHWSREHLSSLARPRRWMDVEQLQELPSGKLDRRAARHLAEAHFAAQGPTPLLPHT